MFKYHKQKGVTLLELIIAISIVAILASIAVPAFNNTISSSRVTSNTNLIVGAMNYARAEAIERRLSVEVKGDSDSGWEVTVDPGGDNEELLQSFTPSQKGLSITFVDITYENDGYRTSGSSKADVLVTDTDTDIKRRICISVSGSVDVNKDGAECS